MKYLPLVLSLFLLYSCSENQKVVPKESAELIDQLVSERFAPVLDVDDELVVRFREGITVKNEIDSKYILLTPRIAGDFEWLDERTLHFKPDQHFQYDQAYALTIPLEQLLDTLPQDDKVLALTFTTRPLEVFLATATPVMTIENDGVSITLEGLISSNQYADPEYIKNQLLLSGPTKQNSIQWTHEDHSRTHRFVLPGIKQTNTQQQIVVQLKEGASTNQTGNNKMIIPIRAAGQFAVEDVFLQQSPEKTIKCIFSQPLKQDQDLRGLIQINGQKENLRTLLTGNELHIFLEAFEEERLALELDQSIRSYDDQSLDRQYTTDLFLEPVKPQLRLGSTGVLVPPVSAVTFPFESINLDTVDIEIFKIYEQNVLQFMQDNALSGSYNLSQVGKIVHRDKVAITTPGNTLNSWQSVALDLTAYIQEDPEAIYQVRIGFQPSYVHFECAQAVEGYIPPSKEGSILDYRYYNYQGWNDPCAPGYYNPDHFIKRNIIYSNLSAIIKRVSSNKFYAATLKISDGSIVSRAEISFYNFQKILLGAIRTNDSGSGEIELTEKPSFAIARHQEGTTYIDLQDAAVNSISDFETSGTSAGNGINAFIYTDRGVYRPGDTIHMHVMVEQGNTLIPDDHPVQLTLKDPQGQVKYDKITKEEVGNIYTFRIPTDNQDKTGVWSAIFTLGNATSSKRIPVETIKPNRLRIGLDITDRITYSNKGKRQINISSSWLHGAPADNLRARIDVAWTNMMPSFDSYQDFQFQDPARQLSAGEHTLFDGLLDQNGKQSFTLQLDQEARYPAMLRGNVTSRVFEKGGSFSENYSSIEVSPYSHYSGVKLPENEWGYASVTIGDEVTFNAVSVTENGQPAGDRTLAVGIYDIDWQWWYYRGQRQRIYELNSDRHTKAVWKSEITTENNGKAVIRFDASNLEYGRKMIRICDAESGHCTGDFFYASGWSSSGSEEERNSLSRLHLSADKSNYLVGEDVSLSIPSEEGSRIFVSIEGGDEIISQEWIKGQEDGTQYSFKVTADMTPNIYAHVTFVQPYAQINNDLPIRMYGVLPIVIEDPETRRKPRLHLPAQIEPKEKFTIGVSEENGRPITYTLAIVDEGLLDLTNFETPDPHQYFYAKQALGVQTWDVYDEILYGLNGRSDKIISIGGDGNETSGKGSKKAIRFKPVVFTAGPFTLAPDERGNHTFTMPDYVGSVRVMVIARDEASVGHTEAVIPVTTPLMVLPTLPRVLSQGEEIALPVTVFAMEDDIRNVAVQVSSNALISIDQPKNNLAFDQVGEQTTSFRVDVAEQAGIAEFDIRATAGSYSATKRISIDIRNPNPVQTESSAVSLEPEKTWTTTYEPFGVPGTNNATVELSYLPPLNLASKLDYLIRYPYGCAEQTTSAAFVQLYLSELSDYVSQATVDRNVKAGITRLIKMQDRSGGFKYWPSTRGKVHDWASSYAGHFLLEAREKGYFVANSVLNKWMDDQKRRANQFRIDGKSAAYARNQSLLNQAYRLYTLSIAGAPNLSAMNLLRAHTGLPATARFLLGAAYARASKENLALDLIQNVSTEVRPYRDMGYTFGSEVRDMALIAQSLSFLDRESQAIEVVRKIMDRLNSSNWYSTQSVAFGFLAIGKLADAYKDNKIEANIESKAIGEQNVAYEKPIFTFSFNPDKDPDKSLSITNNGDKTLFVSFQLDGQRSPKAMLQQPPSNSHIRLNIAYKDLNGKVIDVSNLEQGVDFLAEIEIINLNTRGTKIDEVALTQIVPSGWEIRSGRLNNDLGLNEDAYAYRDVRDDRIHTFFDLNNRKKYVTRFNAAYAGQYFLPPVKVEAMYDKSVFAYSGSQKVLVHSTGVE